MDVDSLLHSTLKGMGVPVERLKYGGRVASYITYQLAAERDDFFADDEEGATEYTYQVHIFSRKDYFPLVKALKKALKAAGFYGVQIGAEVFERDTGYYHIPAEIKFMEV